ncbi:hypothetical protein CCUS01_00466 [Colletotrichum cuscutae]|uniref:Uncharacterized protein n=1 Tax=Colletotrichum cuscutae TaxID=1209917 RepID=A0AAI9Y2W9_9PEZI|nr:hypothetical protein CCUS01_00466 [Colletotrichum cuscutae]
MICSRFTSFSKLKPELELEPSTNH